VIYVPPALCAHSLRELSVKLTKQPMIVKQDISDDMVTRPIGQHAGKPAGQIYRQA
jgi:hypothetical protein